MFPDGTVRTRKDGMKCTSSAPAGALKGFVEEMKLEKGKKPERAIS
jgi:hypothetical protein